MMRFLKIVLIIAVIGFIGWFMFLKKDNKPTSETKHQVLLEHIEAMGKLELVKYRFSDVVEHKNMTQFLPDASVLLIIKADAVGCIDLTKIAAEDIEVVGDSVSIALPQPELCYVKIDHKASKVYDTKMAFFREAKLVDEAFKAAEAEVTRVVGKSDILQQTKTNAMTVFKPILQGLGFAHVTLTFK